MNCEWSVCVYCIVQMLSPLVQCYCDPTNPRPMCTCCALISIPSGNTVTILKVNPVKSCLSLIGNLPPLSHCVGQYMVWPFKAVTWFEV